MSVVKGGKQIQYAVYKKRQDHTYQHDRGVRYAPVDCTRQKYRTGYRQKSENESCERKRKVREKRQCYARYQDEGCAYRSSGRYAQSIGRSQGILQKCLHARAAYGQGTAYHKGTESSRHSDSPEDRIHHGSDAFGSSFAGYMSSDDAEQVLKRDIYASCPDTDNKYKKAQDCRYGYL